MASANAQGPLTNRQVYEVKQQEEQYPSATPYGQSYATASAYLHRQDLSHAQVYDKVQPTNVVGQYQGVYNQQTLGHGIPSVEQAQLPKATTLNQLGQTSPSYGNTQEPSPVYQGYGTPIKQARAQTEDPVLYPPDYTTPAQPSSNGYSSASQQNVAGSYSIASQQKTKPLAQSFYERQQFVSPKAVMQIKAPAFQKHEAKASTGVVKPSAFAERMPKDPYQQMNPEASFQTAASITNEASFKSPELEDRIHPTEDYQYGFENDNWTIGEKAPNDIRRQLEELASGEFEFGDKSKPKEIRRRRRRKKVQVEDEQKNDIMKKIEAKRRQWRQYQESAKKT